MRSLFLSVGLLITASSAAAQDTESIDGPLVPLAVEVPVIAEETVEDIVPEEEAQEAEALEVQASPETVSPPIVEEAPVESDVDYTALILPKALPQLIEDVCLPHRRSETDLAGALETLGNTGLSSTLKPRLAGNPAPGDYWTLTSREGEFMAGSVTAAPQSCQIMAVSPFGTALSAGLSKSLSEFAPAFVFDETSGTSVGEGITWSRFTSDAGEFVDIVVYESRGETKNSTLHITVG